MNGEEQVPGGQRGFRLAAGFTPVDSMGDPFVVGRRETAGDLNASTP